MTAKKIIVAAALLFGATSAALAQSAWTDGSAADSARAGFASSYGGGLYAYAPGSVSGQANGSAHTPWSRTLARVPLKIRL